MYRVPRGKNNGSMDESIILRKVLESKESVLIRMTFTNDRTLENVCFVLRTG